MIPIIKGLAALAKDEEFLALEMDRISRAFSLTHFNAGGKRLSSFGLPISTARKMMVSGDNKIVLLLQEDHLDAVYLNTGALKSWRFPEAERLFSAKNGVIAQSDNGSMAFISSDLEMTLLQKQPETVALFPDLNISVERLPSMFLSLLRKDTFQELHKSLGKYVLDSILVDPLLWLAESGSFLRAFDIENGNQVFELMPKSGWHFDLLSPTKSESSILAKAINFETGSHMEIFMLSWQKNRLCCDLRAQLAISPPHSIFTNKGSFLVSGTREIFDSQSGHLINRF